MKKKFKLNNLILKTILVLACLALAMLYNNFKGS